MPAQSDVVIKLTFEAGNADAVTQRMNAMFRNMETQSRRAATSQLNLATSVNKLWRSALYGLTSYMSVAAARSFVRGIEQNIQRIQEMRVKFEKEITPLLSLKDNIRNIGAMKSEVLGLSNAWQQSTAVISKSLFDIDSNTGNLSETIRKKLRYEILELARATGGDLQTATNLMLRSYQMLNREIKDPNVLQNMMMFTQREAALTFEDMAQRLPEILKAGTVAGLNAPEVLGTLIGTSKIAGLTPELFTGLKNAFLLMTDVNKQQAAGLKFTGDWKNRVSQLNEAFEKSPNKVRKLFGQETILAAQSIAQMMGDILQNVEALSNLKLDNVTDMAKDINEARMSDPGARSAYWQESREMARENVLKTGPDIAGNTWYTRYQYGGTARMRESGGAPGASLVGGLHGLMYPAYAVEEQIRETVNKERFRAQEKEVINDVMKNINSLDPYRASVLSKSFRAQMLGAAAERMSGADQVAATTSQPAASSEAEGEQAYEDRMNTIIGRAEVLGGRGGLNSPYRAVHYNTKNQAEWAQWGGNLAMGPMSLAFANEALWKIGPKLAQNFPRMGKALFPRRFPSATQWLLRILKGKPIEAASDMIWGGGSVMANTSDPVSVPSPDRSWKTSIQHNTAQDIAFDKWMNTDYSTHNVVKPKWHGPGGRISKPGARGNISTPGHRLDQYGHSTAAGIGLDYAEWESEQGGEAPATRSAYNYSMGFAGAIIPGPYVGYGSKFRGKHRVYGSYFSKYPNSRIPHSAPTGTGGDGAYAMHGGADNTALIQSQNELANNIRELNGTIQTASNRGGGANLAGARRLQPSARGANQVE